MNLSQIVARNIRLIRHANGLSQEELASRAGINRNYVGMIERCENSPTIEVIERLADALNVDPMQLLQRQTRKKRE
jgi:transcriptional regulator with XRE-family HTH domain